MTYSYAYRCARCDSWRGVLGEHVPAADAAALERGGWMIDRPERAGAPRRRMSLDELLFRPPAVERGQS